MINPPFVSICVSSFNRGDIIHNCLKYLIDLDYPKFSYEIIIIDNNSSDNTCVKVKEIIKSCKFNNLNIKLVESNKNLGSSGSFIEAIKYVKSSWDFILKMDEDVILEKSCLKEMIKMSEKVAIKGIIGGKILYYKNKKLIQAIGSTLKPIYAIAKGIGVNASISSKKLNIPMSIDAPNGCMILIPKEIFTSVSWFYEDYFMYYDDHEIMYKSNKKGFINYYCPSAIAYHDTKTGSNIKYANKNWLYYSVRNSIFFMKRNFKNDYLNLTLYFFGHNLKFILGIFLILYFSGIKKIYINLFVYFQGYIDGIIGNGGMKKL